jgi:LPXTG-site transpeptidase (sortase) family protein
VGIMKKTTVIVILAIIFLSIYGMQEVNYFSTKIVIDKNISTPVLQIPAINLDEKANFESLSKGVMIDELSLKPGDGKIIFHGHRTLLGSPFLNINELKAKDKIIVEWPGVGEVNYSVTKSYIVPASHTIKMGNDSKTLYLITCDPIGTAINRLIVEAEPTGKGPLNDKNVIVNANQDYGLFISIGFLIVGLIISYFYPIKEDRKFIFVTVIIISIILFLLYFFPIATENFGFLEYLGI